MDKSAAWMYNLLQRLGTIPPPVAFLRPFLLRRAFLLAISASLARSSSRRSVGTGVAVDSAWTSHLRRKRGH